MNLYHVTLNSLVNKIRRHGMIPQASNEGRYIWEPRLYFSHINPNKDFITNFEIVAMLHEMGKDDPSKFIVVVVDGNDMNFEPDPIKKKECYCYTNQKIRKDKILKIEKFNWISEESYVK
jgi:hypothetical protein